MVSRPAAVLQMWMNANPADVTLMLSVTTHQDPSHANANLAIKGMASDVCLEVRWGVRSWWPIDMFIRFDGPGKKGMWGNGLWKVLRVLQVESQTTGFSAETHSVQFQKIPHRDQSHAGILECIGSQVLEPEAQDKIWALGFIHQDTLEKQKTEPRQYMCINVSMHTYTYTIIRNWIMSLWRLSKPSICFQ